MNYKHLYKLPSEETMLCEDRKSLPRWQQKMPIVTLVPTLVIRDLCQMTWTTLVELKNLTARNYMPKLKNTCNLLYNIGYWELNMVDPVDKQEDNQG